MNLEDYQKFCRTTDLFPLGEWLKTKHFNGLNELIAHRTLCLCGEVGELANKVKKLKRDSPHSLTPKFRQSAIGELGDMMWYISILCDLLDVSLEHVLLLNEAKLSQRKEQDKIRGDGDER
jgi:NTP pyrophosphatase (non-canonical NTP hydrolase)